MTVVASDNTTTPQSVLDSYEQYLRGFNDLCFEENVATKVLYPASVPGLMVSAKFYLVDEKIKCESIEHIGNEDNESKGEIVIDGQKEILATFDQSQNRYSVISDPIDYPKTISERRNLIYGSLFLGSEFFETLPTRKAESIFDVLRHTNLAIEEKNESSVDFYVLSASGDGFTSQLWFERQNLGAPTKIVYSRSPDRVRLYENISHTLVVNKFQKIGNTYFPQAMEIKHEIAIPSKSEKNSPLVMSYSEGKLVENPEQTGVQKWKGDKKVIVQDIVWKNVKYINKSDSYFCLERLFTIPNGTAVRVNGTPQIQYIWMDGKIVPKTDELMLQIARGGHKFMPGPSEPRFWLMGIGILLIVLAVGVKAYKKYKGIET